MLCGTFITLPPLRNKRKKGFMVTLIDGEPTFSYIFTKLPTSDEDIAEIVYLISDGNLQAGSDGADNHNMRLVFATTMESEELTSINTLSHEVY